MTSKVDSGALSRAVRWMTRYYSWTLFVLHLLLISASATIAFLLRFDFGVPSPFQWYLLTALCAWLPVKFGAFALFGLERTSWRYVSVDDVLRIGMANLVGSAASFIIIGLTVHAFPRSVYILDLIVCFLLMAGVRISARLLSEASGRTSHGRPRQNRTLIYGAGDAAVALLRELRQNASLPYHVVGFVDDDPRKRGVVIHGAKVLGAGAQLGAIVEHHAIEAVLIAMPSASGSEMTTILRRCHEAGVTYKTVPGLGEMIEGAGLARQIRDVAVEDLLGRNPVHIDHDRTRARVEGRVVLVTGAAGSIGSELCRQIARFNPQCIIGFEIAETALFELEREMRARFPGVKFQPEIGSVQNGQRFREVLQLHRASLVYHAAAYKHVPMMESHIFEALENNVFGTYNVAQAAIECGVADFVMISSDKAVRPTSVMGVSKRVSELLILGLQSETTNFVSVRFGNVLDSNGSVVRIFRQQIAAGGPVTVTHPEMRRYFMTIPEAAQLVVQASALGKAGQIFVLDMGESVRIYDLARDMILLSGLKPDEEIKIEITGIRPGEKLYEELHMLDENLTPTVHEKIKIFTADGAARIDVGAAFDELRDACGRRDTAEVVMALKAMVPDYNPSSHVLRDMLGRNSEHVRAAQV